MSENRASRSVPLPLVRFDCTECARCCRSLLDPTAKALPENAEALAQGGFYAIPRTGGLQVWSWERRSMLDAAAAMGEALAFSPVMGVIDERTGRFVVLLWELQANECPLVRGNHCGAYEARPLICRAYPLLLQGRDIVISSHCPGAVYKDEPAEVEAYLYHAYKPCVEAATLAGRMPEFTVTILRFLESSGLLRLARGRTLGAAAEAAAEAAVDLTDLVEEAGVLTHAAILANVSTIRERANAEMAAKHASA